MKKISKLLIVFLLVIICSSCGNSKFKSISYSELKDKLKNEDTFFFVVIKDGCQYCERFVPIVAEVLDEYDIVGYKLNYSDLSESDDEAFYAEYGIDSTPTTVFIKNGQEVSILQRIEGSVSKEKLVSKLKNNGFINE